MLYEVTPSKCTSPFSTLSEYVGLFKIKYDPLHLFSVFYVDIIPKEAKKWKYVFSGLFEVRAQEYLDSLPGSEQRGVNKFLKGLGETFCTTSVIFSKWFSQLYLYMLSDPQW